MANTILEEACVGRKKASSDNVCLQRSCALSEVPELLFFSYANTCIFHGGIQ